MKKSTSLNRLAKQSIALLLAGTMCMGSSALMAAEAEQTPAQPDASTVLLEEQKKEAMSSVEEEATTPITTEEPPFVVTDPSVTVDSGEGIDGMTMLYIGGGVGAVALGALALSGGGSSSDSGGTVPEPTVPVVGPSIYGSNWVGFLDLKNTQAQGYQNVTATIIQNGSAVQITTSSTLLYGRLFNGKINGSGYMKMYDSVTGEDWTTHRRNASTNQIELLDYVNDLNRGEFDRLYLSR